MTDALFEALHDTLWMVPLLFLIYAALEVLEQKLEPGLRKFAAVSASAGPLIGALLGCFPQCGFSVIATSLYTQRVITFGTLIAVYLSTSDEAFPVILAQPGQIKVIIPLLLTKVVVATIAGYAIDLICGLSFKGRRVQPHDPSCKCVEESHCCGRRHAAGEPWQKSFVLYPLKHALTVALFVFAASALINLIIWRVSPADLSAFFMPHSVYQPFMTALVGLLPNCAASVAITQLFLKGAISFGSTVAGLCASAGLGLLVLIKEERNWARIMGTVLCLFSLSFLSGTIINYILGI